ncbi:hypothetical protein CCZ00_13870 [Pseudomonas savastanoi pv. fraxini]|nr:hypothetical protein CCZ00_13870 [Pseudomonas savastanoi pv. fraxini]
MFAKGVEARHLSFLTLQRGNACRDALRHKSAPRHTFRTGRRASRAALPRWSVGTIISRSSSTNKKAPSASAHGAFGCYA